MGPLIGTVPIVFVIVPDPVGAGYVNSLAQPERHGLLTFDAGKWLDLLKQVAPGVTRVAVLRDPLISGGLGQFAAVQSAASWWVEVTAINMRDTTRLSAPSSRCNHFGWWADRNSPHRNLIVTLASRYKLPAVYYEHDLSPLAA